MQREPTSNGSSRFELPGSRAHYPPFYPYSIKHIHLKIEPDLNAGTIAGEAMIAAKTTAEIDSLELDAVDLEVSSIEEKTKGLKPRFHTRNDKLVIDLGMKFGINKDIILTVSYTTSPRKGFYFIRPDRDYPKKRREAWTQGQTNEARHWFPSIDHPQAKFTFDIDVVAPIGFEVISNGIFKDKRTQRGGKKIIHRWSIRFPIPSYLVSIVIGEYNMTEQNGALFYYVPKAVNKEDRDRTFKRTAHIFKYFEEYFKVSYPYEKYSQVTVQDFLAQGMENASCTTLTIDTIHDKRVEKDYPSENLVSHEIAHQWFGDLVTCKDWQDLWLNESFATYCEALYQENWNGKNDFYQLMMEFSDSYFEEASTRYIRPVVTNVYKHPDDLFDTHSYAKGACVIHMLRHVLGEEHFRNSLKTYLEEFAHKTADTHDIIKVFEKVSGKNLQYFFDQWIFRAGHPELEINFSYDRNAVVVRISQVQTGKLFDLDLDVKVVFQGGQEKQFKIAVSEKESTLHAPTEGLDIEWISLNSQLETLVKIVDVKAPWELLVNQLQRGRTIVERVNGARWLKNYPSLLVARALRDAILSDKFWSVSVEAAKSLGTIKEQYAYDALRECLTKVEDPRTKRAVVAAMGGFRHKELIELMKPILDSEAESYAVQSEAAIAIGKTKDCQKISMLENLIAGKETYLDLVAQGAITGLKEFTGDKRVADIILRNSEYGKRSRIREASTLALGKFASGNQQIVDHLRNILLRDKWFRVRRNACKALAEAEITDATADLQWVANHDIDAGVRRIADECLIILKEKLEIAKRRAAPPTTEPKPAMEYELDEKSRKNIRHLGFLNKIDSYENRDR